jgi:hypothetical protein
VLKVGSDLAAEMTLLERVTWLFPETAVVVAGDTDNPLLAQLAWDLGATYVLLPCLSHHELFGIVLHWLETASRAARTKRLAPLPSPSPVKEPEDL